MKGFLLLLTLLCAIFHCHSRPDGAPQSACSSLMPVHSGILAQDGIPPYNVTAVKSGDKITVTITSDIEEFKGFVLQARSGNDRTKLIDGEFTTSEMAKAIDCFNGKKNTLTHVNTDVKKQIVTEWTPRGVVKEDVVFRATVAKTYTLFWTEVDSSPKRITNGGDETDAGKTSDTHSMYEFCFVTKGCFGLPSGCAQRRDCEVLLTYSRYPNGIKFELHGYLDSLAYMAMGLSKDNAMGEDSVTECIRDGTDIIARESWNEGRSNTRTKELSKDDYSSSFTDGLSSCSWGKTFRFESNEQEYDLKENNYYILLARGELTSSRHLKYHEDRLPSSIAVNFTAFEAFEADGVTDSVKVHGTFMVTAWVGFVSFGILLARHFKNAFEGSTLGGVKIWFALHRAFMIIGLSFVVVAFIVIFVHKNGWNYSTSNPHAIFGCIATGLGLLNPIMAAFRPAPDHRKRPIFNWLHWGVGNSAQIIAVIAIFYAVSLPSSGLKKSFYWVMAVFVIVHVIFHLLYQVHTWTQSKKKNNELKMNEMNGARSYTVQHEQTIQANDTSDNEFRILMLSIYTMFVLAILIALYSLIGVA